ncbi:MAG: hypothetical protein CM15mV132_040 [uncultured marine virus]|nr:MAG: hypothetical protein CM15mV132_040 [uncultured marine virus]
MVHKQSNYIEKNKDGTLERVEALTTAELQRATDPVGIAKRVKATVDTIIKERVDVTDDAIAFYGHGKSKHFRHRTLDIPNKFVTDYIVRNPVQVMKIYTQKELQEDMSFLNNLVVDL